jgi:sulfur carrier protein
MTLSIVVNGQPRTFDALSAPANLEQVVTALDLKGDLIAVEHNGVIAPRDLWPQTEVRPQDRLEIVHFVGGGHAE